MSNGIEKDEAIAGLIGALAEQYRKQVATEETPLNETRLDVVRKLSLISDAVKGLMRHRQLDMDL